LSKRINSPLYCGLIVCFLIVTSCYAGAAQIALSPKARATVDLTGYWVSIVNEDWRFRMKVAEKGNVEGIPATPLALRLAGAWDPGKDEAEGNACKNYGAAAIMRVPTRLHITWQDDSTLKLETDAGMQTRLFHFGAAARVAPGGRSLQGFSVAEWDQPREVGVVSPGGTLKVVTTSLNGGYLRNNGIPYGERAMITEYLSRTPETFGETYLIVTTIVEDPDFLFGPFVTSSHFKKIADTNNGWDPQPCSVR